MYVLEDRSFDLLTPDCLVGAIYIYISGHGVVQLRPCATSWKVAGSIGCGVIGIFQ